MNIHRHKIWIQRFIPVNIVHHFTQIGQNRYFISFILDKSTFCWPNLLYYWLISPSSCRSELPNFLFLRPLQFISTPSPSPIYWNYGNFHPLSFIAKPLKSTKNRYKRNYIVVFQAYFTEICRFLKAIQPPKDRNVPFWSDLNLSKLIKDLNIHITCANFV